MHYTETPS